MSRIVSIIVLFIIISCGGVAEHTVKDFELSKTDSEVTSERSTFSELDLIESKLLEFYELHQLKNQHPEFVKTIEKQLLAHSKNVAVEQLKLKNIRISSLTKVGLSKKINDSTQALKIKYLLHLNNNSIMDSAIVHIAASKIKVDGISTTAKKISFQNFN